MIVLENTYTQLFHSTSWNNAHSFAQHVDVQITLYGREERYRTRKLSHPSTRLLSGCGKKFQELWELGIPKASKVYWESEGINKRKQETSWKLQVLFFFLFPFGYP